MLEMSYGKALEKGYEILDNGEFKGRKYFIVSLSAHPVVYVELKESESTKSKNYFDYPFIAHGGFTFLGKIEYVNDGLLYIGWDYAHNGDKVKTSLYASEGKEWTTEEIHKEMEQTIKNMNKMKWDKKQGRFIIK